MSRAAVTRRSLQYRLPALQWASRPAAAQHVAWK
jgi:hypothetical protein